MGDKHADVIPLPHAMRLGDVAPPAEPDAFDAGLAPIIAPDRDDDDVPDDDRRGDGRPVAGAVRIETTAGQ